MLADHHHFFFHATIAWKKQHGKKKLHGKKKWICMEIKSATWKIKVALSGMEKKVDYMENISRCMEKTSGHGKKSGSVAIEIRHANSN